jgi:hypothetical protein
MMFITAAKRFIRQASALNFFSSRFESFSAKTVSFLLGNIVFALA